MDLCACFTCIFYCLEIEVDTFQSKRTRTRTLSLPFFQCLNNVVQTHGFDSEIEKILKYKSDESGGFVLQWISCSGF